jgi:hypothetical protein
MTSASALSSQAAASSMLTTAAVASLFCISTKSRERATAVSRLSTASLCPNRDTSPSRHSRNRALQQNRHGKYSGRTLNMKRQL